MTSAKPTSIARHLTGTAPEPPPELGPSGSRLWNSTLAQWDIPDAPSLAVLQQACSACDRAESLRQRIEADGETIASPSGAVKAHPLLMVELSARGFVARLLARLGLLDTEPKRGPGRPPNVRAGGW